MDANKNRRCPICGTVHQCGDWIIHLHPIRNGKRKHYRRACCSPKCYALAKRMNWFAILYGNGDKPNDSGED